MFASSCKDKDSYAAWSPFTVQDKNHHIYCDNYFSSVNLFLDLLEQGTYACGTLRSNRKGFPKDILNIVKEGLPSRGDLVVRQMKESKSSNIPVVRSKKVRNLNVCIWQDTRPVVVLSSHNSPGKTAEVSRKKKDGAVISIPCPSVIIDYNKYMGGIDHNDQLRQYYHVRQKCRKYYKYIF